MSKTSAENSVKLLINSTYGKRQLRIKCATNDGANVVFDLMDGGLINVQTSHGHYVAMSKEDVKRLILFAMGHLFPDS